MNHFIKSMIVVLGFASLSNLSHAQLSPTNNDWTGFYGGLNIGGIFNKATLNAKHLGFIGDGVCNRKTQFSNFFPGLQLGYLRQYDSNIVLGIEGDYTYTNKQGKTACVCDHLSSISDQFAIKNRQQGSLRGRAGYALNRLLPFVTAGGSLANLGLSYHNEGGDHYSKYNLHSGWVVGGGLEWSLSQAWSIRAEYYYDHYGSAINMHIPVVYELVDPNGGLRASLYANNVRVAINYWV